MNSLPSINPHAVAWHIEKVLARECGKDRFSGDELTEAFPHIEAVLRAYNVAPIVMCLSELEPGGPFCQRPKAHDGSCGGAA